MKHEPDAPSTANQAAPAPTHRPSETGFGHAASCLRRCGDCGRCPAASKPAFPAVEIKPGVTAALAEDLGRVLAQARSPAEDALLAQAEAGAEALAAAVPELRRQADALKAPHGPPALVIRGLPVDDIRDITDPTPLGALVALSLARLIGHSFQYRQQNGGRLVAELRAKPAFAGKANTGESNLPFEDHTDDRAFAPDHACEWIGLVGIRNSARVATTYTPIAPVLRHLPAEQLRVLTEPRYSSRAPTSFGFRMQVWTPPVPVLWRAAGEWEVGLPTYNCRPADAADTVAAEALAALKRLLGEERFRVPVVVEKGVALIFANNRGLHGRAGYEGERLLLRTYIRRSLDTLRAKSGEPGPVFDAWDLLR